MCFEFCVHVWERLTALLAPALGLFNPICKELSRHSCMALLWRYASALCRKREWTVGSLHRKKAERECFFGLNRKPSPQINTFYSHCLFRSSNPPALLRIAMWFDWTRPSVWAKSFDFFFFPLLPPDTHASFIWPLRFFSLLHTSSPSFPIPSIQFLRR